MLITLLSMAVASQGFTFSKGTEPVVVIDTGYNQVADLNGKMCSFYTDLTGKGIQDDIGHGTNVASIIGRGLRKNQCILMIKFYHNEHDKELSNKSAIALGIALELKAKYVNMSYGGGSVDNNEYANMTRLVNSGAIITMAAGNDDRNLSERCNYYPACYDIQKKIVVMNFCFGRKAPSSNYGGPVNAQAEGCNVNAGGYVMTGTSQAAALVMASILRRK